MTDFTPPSYSSTELPPANPVTRRAHRKEVLRQIVLPLVVAILVLGAAIFFLARSGAGSAERWAEISSIVVIAIVMIGLLIPLVLVFGLIYVCVQLLRILPSYARLTQLAIQRVQSQVRSGADISVQPLLQIQSFIAMVDALFGRRK